VVHEASRPCVSIDLITETVKAAKRYGCGIAAARVSDTVKLVEKGQKVSKTMPANVAWAAQTPQAFKRDILDKALKSAVKRKAAFQDESEMMERTTTDVHVVPSTTSNLKIASADDLALAEALVRLQ
jgi:2-C-methyl-D-erythritol 4-phosphate cytidylyltransferase